MFSLIILLNSSFWAGNSSPTALVTVWRPQLFYEVIKFLFVVRFKVFTAVTMKNAVFLDVAQCRYCVNRRFGGIYHLHLQGIKLRALRTSVSRWLQLSAINSPHVCQKPVFILVKLAMHPPVAGFLTTCLDTRSPNKIIPTLFLSSFLRRVDTSFHLQDISMPHF
jgi:hypothetical protein